MPADPSDPEIMALAVQLATLLAKTSEESRFHLSTALQAGQLNVSGDLVVRIPRRVNEHVQVKWVGGSIRDLFTVP